MNGAASVAVHVDVNAQCIVGQQLFDQLRPFDEAEVAAVEIVFEAHVVCLFDAADSVEVEVKYFSY